MLDAAELKKELVRAMRSKQTAHHPVFRELFQPRRNDELLRLMALQTYQLTKMFERYVAGLFYHCPIPSFRRRLASNLYEEVTGELSKSDGHLELMQKFLRAIGISDEEAAVVEALPETRDLLEFRRALVEDPAQHHRAAAAIMIASEGQTIQKEGGRHPYMMLAELYGLTAADVQFFAVHAEEDVHHVAEGLDYTSELCTTAEMQREAIETVRQTVEHFWSHYDGIYRQYLQRAEHAPSSDANARGRDAPARTDQGDDAVHFRWLDRLEGRDARKYLSLFNGVLAQDDTVGFAAPLDVEAGQKVVRDLDRDLREGRSHLLVAEANDRFVFQITLALSASPNNRHVAGLFRAMVDPSVRSKGLLWQAAPHLVSRCQALGIELVHLDVRAGCPAESAWRHVGFETFGVLPGYSRVRGSHYDGVYMYMTLEKGRTLLQRLEA